MKVNLGQKQLYYNWLLPLFDPKSQLLRSSIITRLINHFGGAFGHATNIKQNSLGFGLIHYALIRLLHPESILCLGSEKGFIPAICALACQDNHFGHVNFVDAGKNNLDKNSWGGTGFWKRNNPQKHFSLYHLDQYLTFHLMTTQQYANKFPHQKYDYIYIDADHSYPGVKFDYETFWPKLVSGGFMSFHDIKLQGLSRGDEYGVWKLWQEIKSSHKFELPTFDNCLGFIQKTK